MKVKREDLVGLLKAAGIPTAAKADQWSDARLLAQVKKLPDLIGEDQDVGEYNGLVDELINAVEEGEAVEIDSGKAKAPKKKAAKKTTPAKAATKTPRPKAAPTPKKKAAKKAAAEEEPDDPKAAKRARKKATKKEIAEEKSPAKKAATKKASANGTSDEFGSRKGSMCSQINAAFLKAGVKKVLTSVEVSEKSGVHAELTRNHISTLQRKGFVARDDADTGYVWTGKVVEAK